jgi:hypothetical protein
MSLESASTPAWDPSSRTPQHSAFCASPEGLPPSQQVSQDTVGSASRRLPESSATPLASQHVLLDDRLLGVKLNVVVNGGEYNNKEMEAVV